MPKRCGFKNARSESTASDPGIIVDALEVKVYDNQARCDRKDPIGAPHRVHYHCALQDRISTRKELVEDTYI